MSAIRQAAAAIGGVHRDAGRENPCQHPGVRRTLAGITRQAAAPGRSAPRPAAALDADALAAILYVTAATMAALDAIRQGAPAAAPVFGLSAGQIGRRITAAAAARYL